MGYQTHSERGDEARKGEEDPAKFIGQNSSLNGCHSVLPTLVISL